MSGSANSVTTTSIVNSVEINDPGFTDIVFNANIHAARMVGGEETLKKLMSPEVLSHLKSIGGEVAYPQGDNGAILGLIRIPEDASEEAVETLKSLMAQNVKNLNGDSFGFKVLNNVGEALDVIKETPVKVAEKVIEPAIDQIKQWFGGAAIEPMFDKLSGNIKISMGSEARANQYVPVTDIKNMTFGEVQDAVAVLGDNVNNLGYKRFKKQEEGSRGFVAKVSMISDAPLEEAEGQDQQDEIKTKDVDPRDDKCLVFFTKVKSNDSTKDIPLVAINHRTLYAVDLIKSKKLKARKNPYFVKGLFNHLTIKPIKDGDDNMQKLIRNFLMRTLLESVAGLANLCQVTIGEVKEDGKIKEWIPKAEDNDKPRPELGNFTTAEFCNILNNPKDAYKYFGGTYATDITKTDDKGNVVSSKNNHVKVEDKANYIQNKIYPVISNKNTDVYKELAANALIKKYFMDEDGNFKKVPMGDTTVPIVFTPAVAPLLYRSMENFDSEQKKTLADNIKKFFGNDSQAELKDKAKAIQMLSSIIWKYKGDMSAWNKQIKLAKPAKSPLKQPVTNTSGKQQDS